MKNRLAVTFILAMGVASVSRPALAHHSSAAFDVAHMVTMRGTVTDLEWTNPHVFIYLDVKDDKGNVEQWRVEGNSPNMLTRVGWNREMVKPGNQITVTGSPAKDGKKIMRLHSVTLASGQQLDGEGFK
jgi:hypothetical protein